MPPSDIEYVVEEAQHCSDQQRKQRRKVNRKLVMRERVDDYALAQGVLMENIEGREREGDEYDEREDVHACAD